MTSVPVLHGADYTCQAFVFGARDRVAYLSDVSAVPDKALAFLAAEPLDLLVLDCLLEASHSTHFGPPGGAKEHGQRAPL